MLRNLASMGMYITNAAMRTCESSSLASRPPPRRLDALRCGEREGASDHQQAIERGAVGGSRAQAHPGVNNKGQLNKVTLNGEEVWEHAA